MSSDVDCYHLLVGEKGKSEYPVRSYAPEVSWLLGNTAQGRPKAYFLHWSAKALSLLWVYLLLIPMQLEHPGIEFCSKPSDNF